MDRTLNLVFSETLATDNRRYHLSSVRTWVGDRRPRLRRSKGEEEEEKHTFLKQAMVHESSSCSKGLKGNLRWKPGTTTDDSRSSQKQWSRKKTKKESRWEEVTKVFSMKQEYRSKKRKHLGRTISRKVRKGRMKWCNTRRNCWLQPERTMERRPNCSTASTLSFVVAMSGVVPGAKKMSSRGRNSSSKAQNILGVDVKRPGGCHRATIQKGT